MNVFGYTGQVNGQVKAQVAASVTPQDTPQVTPQVGPPVTTPVGGQSESLPEWFSKGGRTFLSANKNFMAGWETRPPAIEAGAREMDKTVKKTQEKIGV